MRSLKWALIQYDLCPYKKRKFGHRYIQKEDHVKTQKDGHLQFKSSVLLACNFPTVINIINPFCPHHFYHQRTFIKCLLGDGTLQGEAGSQCPCYSGV